MRPWICHDGVIDCLEGCPVGEPNTLAPSRLHREGIPAHVPTTMAIRAGEEMATQTDVGTNNIARPTEYLQWRPARSVCDRGHW